MDQKKNTQTHGETSRVVQKPLVLGGTGGKREIKSTSSRSFESQLQPNTPAGKPNVWFTGGLNKAKVQENSPKSPQDENTTLSPFTSPISLANMIKEVNPSNMEEKWPRLGSSEKDKQKQSTNDSAKSGHQPTPTVSPSPSQRFFSYSMAAQSRLPSKASGAPSEQSSDSKSRRISLSRSGRPVSAQSPLKIQALAHPPPQGMPTVLENGAEITSKDTFGSVVQSSTALKVSPALTAESNDSFVTNPFDPDYIKATEAKKQSGQPRNPWNSGVSLFSKGSIPEKRPSVLPPTGNRMDRDMPASKIGGEYKDNQSETESTAVGDFLNVPSRQEWTPPSESSANLPSTSAEMPENGRAQPSRQTGAMGQQDAKNAETKMPTLNEGPAEIVPTPILVQFNYGIQFAYATHSAVIGLYIPPVPPSSPSASMYQPITCRQLITEVENKANYPVNHGKVVNRLRSIHVIWQSKADSLNWVAPTTIIDTLPRSHHNRPGSYPVAMHKYADPNDYYYNGDIQQNPTNEDGTKQWGSGLNTRKGAKYGFDQNGNDVIMLPINDMKQEEQFEFYNGATTSPSKWARRGFEKSKVPTGKWADLTTLCDEELWLTFQLMAARGWKANLVVQFELEETRKW